MFNNIRNIGVGTSSSCDIRTTPISQSLYKDGRFGTIVINKRKQNPLDIVKMFCLNILLRVYLTMKLIVIIIVVIIYRVTFAVRVPQSYRMGSENRVIKGKQIACLLFVKKTVNICVIENIFCVSKKVVLARRTKERHFKVVLE